VFDLEHREIAGLLGNSEVASRQLLSRARTHVAEERRSFEASQEEHRRLLQAFVAASSRGDQDQMIHLLAEDATLVVDVGPEGKRVGRIRNAGRPISGARRIAAFLAAVARESAGEQTARECQLNGQPAIGRLADGKPVAALMLSVLDGRIRHLFVQADPPARGGRLLAPEVP
jgi:RNA polymerase sigma-70 factor (ECF subfamily)